MYYIELCFIFFGHLLIIAICNDWTESTLNFNISHHLHLKGYSDLLGNHATFSRSHNDKSVSWGRSVVVAARSSQVLVTGESVADLHPSFSVAVEGVCPRAHIMRALDQFVMVSYVFIPHLNL